MSNNLQRYESDLKALIEKGERLRVAMQLDCMSPQDRQRNLKNLGEKADIDRFVANLPSFEGEYQAWYSEATVVIRHILPERLDDFTHYYETPRARREVTFANYSIADYLVGLRVTRGTAVVVDGSAALPRFSQQLAIVKAIQQRFRSSLFDIRQMVQADLFDSELDAATELTKNGFTRAAGAMAGVVLERHLKEVCASHNVGVRKRKPQIADLNDGLKKAGVIDVAAWRSIQYLGDLRNLCDHDREVEPTKEQATDLIQGVGKVTKTIL